MPIPQKIIKYLDSISAKYERVAHKIVYTSFDKAATLKVKPNIIGKTLVLKTGRDLAIALIPGNKNLDKNKFKKIANDWLKKQGKKPVKEVAFISEKAMKNRFKGMKLGAIPPFGNLWKIPTFADKALLKEPKIILNSGAYDSSIKITASTLKKLVPDLIIGNFSKAKK